MVVDLNPLTAPPIKEVPLPNSPLVRVIAQVKYPLIASTEKPEFIAKFQEAIRDTYPVLRPEQTQSIVLSAQGVTAIGSQKTWRFSDLDGNWRVSLAPDFVALETTAYSSRKEFFDRLEVIVNALEHHVGPKVLDRIGVRYIDRIRGEAIDRISDLVRPEILGVAALSIAKSTQRTMSESLFDFPGKKTQLLTRWGMIPAHETYDPNALEPIDEKSWILDIDMFSAEQRRFNGVEIAGEAREYAERIYRFFRWAITDEFLQSFGGRAL